MRTLVYARHRLVDPSLDAHAAALLLEGSWPGQSSTVWRTSLDDAIDGRFEWIDLQASRLGRARQPRTRDRPRPAVACRRRNARLSQRTWPFATTWSS